MTRTPPDIVPYGPQDAAAVVAFFADAGRRDPTLEPPTRSEWDAYAARSFTQGGRDFACARVDGELAGLLLSFRLDGEDAPVRSVRIVVHPRHRRRGVGRRLLRHAQAQDGGAAVTLRADNREVWLAGRALLEREGFRPTHATSWMGIDRVGPEDAAPEGIGIAAYGRTPAEDAAWRDLCAEGFAGTPGYAPLEPADVAALREEEGFGLWLARDLATDRYVGMCHVKRIGGEPWVDGLVVARDARGRGLGRALMRRGLHALRAGHAGRIRLSVRSDNTAAQALYRSMGFTVDEVVTTWERPAAARAP